jgi:MATE family multidrug resistance protein
VVALKLLEWLLPAISTSTDISSLVEQYLRILIWIIPLELLAFTVIAISNGAGRTFWPAAINVVAFLAMLLAIWLFVYGNAGFIAMGSAGIAYSFLFAILTKCILSALLLFQSDFQTITFASLTRSPDMPYFRRIFRVGLPIGFNEGSLWLYVALLVVFIASMGAEQLAAHNVAHNVFTLSHVFSLGFMGATSILVGHTLGAGDMAGMKSVRMTSTTVMLAASFPVLLVFLFLGEEIAVAYSIYGATETIWLQICTCLLFVKLLDDVTLAGQGFLVGIEQTRTVFFGRIAGLWLVAMPIGYLLSTQYNVLGYWIGLAMGTAVTLLWFARAASIYLVQHNPKVVLKG